jgi:ribosome-associated protein
MLKITPSIRIDERELNFEYIRASGPGGQNVNKVSTAVQLRFDVTASSLPETIRERLVHLAGKRVTSAGILVIEAKQHRTQEQNREEAIRRLTDLIRMAAVRPKTRKKTSPTAVSRRKRLESKRQHGKVKQIRAGKHLEQDG